MDNEAAPPRIIKPRRTYSRAFKDQVLAECRLSGESIAGVALRHGINANLIHKWRRGRQRDANNEFLRLPAPGGPMPSVSPAPSNPAETIRLDVTVGQSHITVHWPVSRLHQGRFVWSQLRNGDALAIDLPQLQALVVGLPWQQAGAGHLIDRH